MDGQMVAHEDFEQYLDRADVLHRLGGNRMVLTTLLKKFLAGSEEETIKNALANFSADREAARVAAHTIKGLAANLSMPALREAAFQLEMAIKQGDEPGDLPQPVYEAYAKTRFVIEAMLAEGDI